MLWCFKHERILRICPKKVKPKKHVNQQKQKLIVPNALSEDGKTQEIHKNEDKQVKENQDKIEMSSDVLEVEQEETQICKSKQDIVNPETKDDSEPQYL